MNSAQSLDQRIQTALRNVIDPELGVNIVDLGLIYSVEVTAGAAMVIMTLTTPGCPMHETLAQGVQIALLELEEITDAKVEVVWDPPWTPAMMTDDGRAQMAMR